MFFRTRPSLFALAALLILSPARALPLGGSQSQDDSSPAAEAQRLYDRANDFVSSINEGDYSYSYIQFHWKRAEGNIERILRLYPDTPTGRALKAGQLKIGPYDLAYYRDRVLARLEEKRIAAYDPVNCAIFLAERKGEQWDGPRRAALVRILEVLSRQKRWSEALKFPVLDSDRLLKWSAIFRVAARYEQKDVIKEMLGSTPKDELPQIDAILGEALALRGLPRKDIAALLDRDPDERVKRGVLSGMVQREMNIQRTAALRLPPGNVIVANDTLKRPDVRDDVDAVAKTFFPKGNAEAGQLLATYRAGLGERPANNAAIDVHLAYLEYLAAFEKFDELATYLRNGRLDAETRSACEMKAIELFARAGRMQDSERVRAPYVAAGGIRSDEAALMQFRGQMASSEIPLTVHEKTFANLPIQDPCVLAQAIMEWSLTLNRAIRGAAPYDAVVQKYAPGYANLAAPKSSAVRDAASASKPY